MAGRQLPFFSLLAPAWMVWQMSGWRGLRGVWPAVAVSGGTFAALQFSISNFVGPELVDIAGGLGSLVALSLMLRVWQPREPWAFDVHAVDYLLKPFSEDRFAEALQRTRERLRSRSSPGEEGGVDVEALVAQARPRHGPLERVLIRDGAQAPS